MLYFTKGDEMTDIFQKDAVNVFCKILKDAGLENVDKNDVKFFVQSLIHASTTETNDIMFGALKSSFGDKDTDNVE
jgi:hypothetical protein